MSSKSLAWTLLAGGAVVPILFFSISALAPKPAADDVAREKPTAEAVRQQEIEMAEKAKADAAAEAVAEVHWRYAKRSLDLFRLSLMDPASAQFREVWAVQFGEGGMGVCGVVNAKNPLGAYVGERPFIAVGESSWTPDHPNFAYHFQTICLDGKKVERMRA